MKMLEQFNLVSCLNNVVKNNFSKCLFFSEIDVFKAVSFKYMYSI